MSDQDAWHIITANFGTGYVGIHGFLLRDGVWSKLQSGTREVLERKDHCPTRVRTPAPTSSVAASRLRASRITSLACT